MEMSTRQISYIWEWKTWIFTWIS